MNASVGSAILTALPSLVFGAQVFAQGTFTYQSRLGADGVVTAQAAPYPTRTQPL
jgi:hypothetical protein